MKRYILAIDQSTQGTKAILFDEQGAPVGKTAMNHRQIVNELGWVEHDPEEILQNTLAVCRKVVADALVDPAAIAALGISNQRETVAAWERETLRPICNAIVWQCARARELCEEFAPAAALVREKTGIPLSPYFSASKMAWILRNVPEAKQLAAEDRLCFGTMDAWLVAALSEEHSFRTDYSNASRTQLFNIRELCWDSELCALFGVPITALPEVCMSDSVFGHTTLGGLLPEAIPICGVLGDSHAALLGQNCRLPGQAKATYGTGSSVMMQTGSRLVTSANGLVTSLAWGLNGTVEYVLEGNLNYTGAVISWLKNDVGLIRDDGESETLARSANPDDRCYFVPAFTGLGAPYWDSGATGLFTGITRTTGRAELVRACLACIAYQITDLVSAMGQDAGVPLAELRADGGPTANAWLMQFQADIADVSVSIPDFQELSAFGAACAAGFAVGIYEAESLYARIGRRRIECQMSDEARAQRLRGWKDAVRQAVHHS